MYERYGKRLLDLFLGSLAILVLCPVIALTWLLVLANFGRPAIFRQKRGGYRCEPFDVMKFRTMTNARDATGHLLPDEQRLPPIGLKLRALSLDELPGLFNVMRGEMSLVGPRPLIYGYMPHYTEHQKRRHDVRPGITGWAQVNGRNALSWEQKFDLDIWYVQNVSLWLDIRILFMTVLKILHFKSVNAEGHATMPLFAPVDDLKGAPPVGAGNDKEQVI
ncbi:MAG: sugar transferase [Phenylobacterium sp.]|nr:sugar transferase [Phenylobacterium sp.]